MTALEKSRKFHARITPIPKYKKINTDSVLGQYFCIYIPQYIFNNMISSYLSNYKKKPQKQIN
jgi:hypothetical protein